MARLGPVKNAFAAALVALPFSYGALAEDAKDAPVQAQTAKQVEKAEKQEVDPIDQIPVKVDNNRNIEPRAARSIAAVANRGKINVIFYGRDKVLLNEAARAMREATREGLPIGTLFLAKEIENITNEDGEIISTREKSGANVYYAGQAYGKRLAINKDEVVDLIEWANEFRLRDLAAEQAKADHLSSEQTVATATPE